MDKKQEAINKLKAVNEEAAVVVEMSFPRAAEYFIELNERGVIDTQGESIGAWISATLFQEAAEIDPSLLEMGITEDEVEEIMIEYISQNTDYSQGMTVH